MMQCHPQAQAQPSFFWQHVDATKRAVTSIRVGETAGDETELRGKGLSSNVGEMMQ